MKKDFLKMTSGSTILLEALVCYAKSHSAADFMWYLTRVFGVALPLHIAVPVRIALLTLSGYNLLSSIKSIAPSLWEKIVNSNNSKDKRVWMSCPQQVTFMKN